MRWNVFNGYYSSEPGEIGGPSGQSDSKVLSCHQNFERSDVNFLLNDGWMNLNYLSRRRSIITFIPKDSPTLSQNFPCILARLNVHHKPFKTSIYSWKVSDLFFSFKSINSPDISDPPGDRTRRKGKKDKDGVRSARAMRKDNQQTVKIGDLEIPWGSDNKFGCGMCLKRYPQPFSLKVRWRARSIVVLLTLSCRDITWNHTAFVVRR